MNGRKKCNNSYDTFLTLCIHTYMRQREQQKTKSKKDPNLTHLYMHRKFAYILVNCKRWQNKRVQGNQKKKIKKQ